MVTTTRLGLFILGFLAATGVEAVRADEAYLCDGGRVVKVPFGKLEEMKRTDACIAGYYGLKVESSTLLETGTIGPPASVVPAGVTPGTSIATDGPRPGSSQTAAPSPIELPKPSPVRQASAEKPSPPRAAAGTDYRNVVLLNPAPGDPAIFRHDR
jgi:hypothetical protein